MPNATRVALGWMPVMMTTTSLDKNPPFYDAQISYYRVLSTDADAAAPA